MSKRMTKTQMGLFARMPVALASGMGLITFFTYGVVLRMDHCSVIEI